MASVPSLLVLLCLLASPRGLGALVAPPRAASFVRAPPPFSRSTMLFKKKKASGGGGGGFGSKAAAPPKTAAAKPKPKPKPKIKENGLAEMMRQAKMSTFRYTGGIRPGKQSPTREVPETVQEGALAGKAIAFPTYAADGKPKNPPAALPWVIEVKTPEEIVLMRAAGRAARQVLDAAGRCVQVGVTTDEIDAVAHREALVRGCYPSPLNYHGFPKSCCTSVNEIICHGIPDDRPLQDGDIVNVDITVYLDGYHGDCSEMFVVGETLDPVHRRLIQATYDCWVESLNFVRPGRAYKDIGGVIEDRVVRDGFTSVKNFCGHGIGSVFHTSPNILHFKNNEPNGVMAPGHTFTIEPMICERGARSVTWPDAWTAATVDGGRTAQFEHTLLVTEDGVVPLTGKIPGESPVQFWEEESDVHQGLWLGTGAQAPWSS